MSSAKWRPLCPGGDELNVFCDVHLIVISPEVIINLTRNMLSEITFLKSLSHFPGANDLIFNTFNTKNVKTHCILMC